MVRKPVLSTVSCHCPSFAATSAFTISLPRGDFSRPDMGCCAREQEKQKTCSTPAIMIFCASASGCLLLVRAKL